MSDLINRQDAINGADEIIKRDTSGNNAVVEAMKAWKTYIGNLPSAERKHGEWMYLYEDNYKCSVCGSWWACTDSQIVEMNYCPCCGADMRGDTDEQIH